MPSEYLIDPFFKINQKILSTKLITWRNKNRNSHRRWPWNSLGTKTSTPSQPSLVYRRPAHESGTVNGDEVAVGIKIVNSYEIEDVYSLATEVHEAESCDHENVVKVHCSFKYQGQLWIVMPPLPRLSIRSMIRASFPRGLPENAVAFILKETLKALNYMHGKNRLHQNLGADCLFLDGTSRVKVAFRSLTYDQNSNDLNSGVLPDWMIAPELMIDYRKGQSKATDIWMFGLLSLELFYGRIPASNLEEFQSLVLGIDDKLRMLKKNQGIVGSGLFRKIGVFSCFSNKDRKKISKPLVEVMAACLSREPKKSRRQIS
ncbi:Serine/threonine-protein kinase pakC [Sesamum angolense]|uniref:Serine/threonine-protein kinase pakC n=1 Tax=Sesamum angolense TaxID=2727404 RepID=A0AAE2C709_9LAMI|nr:Serine/threonine-protein kinase pakC [Sesamum angolense]